MNKDYYIVTIALMCLTAVAVYFGTLAFVYPKPDIKELDMAVVEKTFKTAADYCKEIRSKKFLAQASGITVRAGC